MCESLLELWPASNMQAFVATLLGAANDEEHEQTVDQQSSARALVAYVKSERLQLALHSDDFVASLEKRPLIIGPTELEWLWHLVELCELRIRGLSVGGGNVELTLKDLIAKLAEHGVTAKRFRPSNLLPITVEIVKRLSNWEPDGGEQNHHIVLAICNMILPFPLLDLEDLGRPQDMRVFILFLSLFLDPLASSKRIEVAKIDLLGGGNVQSTGLGSPIARQRTLSSSSLGSPSTNVSPFQVKKSVSSSNISSQVASQLRKKLDEKQAELEQLSVLHAKKVELLKEENASLYQQIADSETELAELTEEFLEMRRHRDEVEEELDRALAAGMANRDKKEELERQLVQLEAALQTRESEWAVERRSLETAVQEAVSRLRQSQVSAAAIAASDARVAQLQQKLRDMESEVARVEAEKARLSKLAAKQKQQLDDGERPPLDADSAAARIAALEAEIDAADEDYDELCRKVETLKQMLAEAGNVVAANEDLKKQVEQMQNERNQLALHMSEQQHLSLMSVEEARRQCEHGISKLKMELEQKTLEWQKEREVLRKKAEEGLAASRKMEIEIESSKTTRMDQKKKIDLLMKRVEMHERRAAVFQEEESKWMTRKRELEGRVSLLTAQVENLDREADALLDRAGRYVILLRRGQQLLEKEVLASDEALERERLSRRAERLAWKAEQEERERQLQMEAEDVQKQLKLLMEAVATAQQEARDTASAAQHEAAELRRLSLNHPGTVERSSHDEISVVEEALKRSMITSAKERQHHQMEKGEWQNKLKLMHSEQEKKIAAIVTTLNVQIDALQKGCAESESARHVLEQELAKLSEAKDLAVSDLEAELQIARERALELEKKEARALALADEKLSEVEKSVNAKLLESQEQCARLSEQLRLLEERSDCELRALQIKMAENEQRERLTVQVLESKLAESESDKEVLRNRLQLAREEGPNAWTKEHEILVEKLRVLEERSSKELLHVQSELRRVEAREACSVRELQTLLSEKEREGRAILESLKLSSEKEIGTLREQLAEASVKEDQAVLRLRVKLAKSEESNKLLAEKLNDLSAVQHSVKQAREDLEQGLCHLSLQHEGHLAKMTLELEAKLKRLEEQPVRKRVEDVSGANGSLAHDAELLAEEQRKSKELEARLVSAEEALLIANERVIACDRERTDAEARHQGAIDAVKIKFNKKLRELQSSERERAANRIEQVEAGKTLLLERRNSGFGVWMWWIVLLLCVLRVFVAPILEI